jgi:hypothetical protein
MTKNTASDLMLEVPEQKFKNNKKKQFNLEKFSCMLKIRPFSADFEEQKNAKKRKEKKSFLQFSKFFGQK